MTRCFILQPVYKKSLYTPCTQDKRNHWESFCSLFAPGAQGQTLMNLSSAKSRLDMQTSCASPVAHQVQQCPTCWKAQPIWLTHTLRGKGTCTSTLWQSTLNRCQTATPAEPSNMHNCAVRNHPALSHNTDPMLSKENWVVAHYRAFQQQKQGVETTASCSLSGIPEHPRLISACLCQTIHSCTTQTARKPLAWSCLLFSDDINTHSQ